MMSYLEDKECRKLHKSKYVLKYLNITLPFPPAKPNWKFGVFCLLFHSLLLYTDQINSFLSVLVLCNHVLSLPLLLFIQAQEFSIVLIHLASSFLQNNDWDYIWKQTHKQRKQYPNHFSQLHFQIPVQVNILSLVKSTVYKLLFLSVHAFTVRHHIQCSWPWL
jgi:hypothetical protein